jgi:hypothetical protein
MSIRRADSSDAAAIAELYLHARRAGSARGAIPPLVHDDEDVRAWLGQVVIPTLRWTFVSNEGAQRFYRRHGFHEVERTDGTRNEEGAPDILFAWSPHQTPADPVPF